MDLTEGFLNGASNCNEKGPKYGESSPEILNLNLHMSLLTLLRIILSLTGAGFDLDF